ncbi:MAG: phosphodiester glycosidase family protein, partial [Synergistaceae bacterium]|nr:phosphodiester glycosidase family protein [Synergistaceae bacterium]
INVGVLTKRHPRTFVGTDRTRVLWGVIDGRDSMHSVGATIEEMRTACKWLGITTGLNLDGGGSSSLWWRGMTFTHPSNTRLQERPIPYAILMFEQGHGVRQ